MEEKIKFYRYKGKNDRLYEVRRTAQGNYADDHGLKLCAEVKL